MSRTISFQPRRVSPSSSIAATMNADETSSGSQTGAHHWRGVRNSRSRVPSDAGQPSMTFMADVVADVPDTEGKQKVGELLSPPPAGKAGDGHQHDDGGRFADLLVPEVGVREAEVAGREHGGVLQREQAPQVEHYHRLDDGHRGGVDGDDGRPGQA